VAVWVPWAVAGLLYLAFRLFYDGLRRPLSKAEIDDFLAAAGDRLHETGNDPEVMRAFLEADDGGEFVMLNLVRAHPGDITNPDTGEVASGMTWLRRYSDKFTGQLFRRGGHPVFVGRKVAGYIDAWNTPADPGWTLFGTMRYRSRRDMIQLARAPEFLAAHPAKLLGLDATFSFPTQRVFAFYVSPRATVALVLALLAALAHIMLLSQG
jgi:hypothetical protein